MDLLKVSTLATLQIHVGPLRGVAVPLCFKVRQLYKNEGSNPNHLLTKTQIMVEKDMIHCSWDHYN